MKCGSCRRVFLFVQKRVTARSDLIVQERVTDRSDLTVCTGGWLGVGYDLVQVGFLDVERGAAGGGDVEEREG